MIGRWRWSGTLLLLVLLAGCSSGQPTETQATLTPIPVSTQTDVAADGTALAADVTAVAVSGSENAYRFAVTVASPDTGCEQFADWWEVLSEDGVLIYRRVLLHSHVDEQPFTRSSGPVVISADTVVIVRAHMAPGGYGGAAMRGSVNGGFEPVEPDTGFAEGVESQPPLPEGCAF
ncbi:MAG: hypothetical protein R3C44_10190 [Chloroflexota bacterium]